MSLSFQKPMTRKRLPVFRIRYIAPPCDAALLMALMRAWWSGTSVAAMAQMHGLSARRVRAILRSVGCCAQSGRGQGVAPDSRRSVPQQRTQAALAMMGHFRFAQLTVRQRAAVAWTATGLSSRDIAKRMGLTGQRVRMLVAAAGNRLRRHTQRAIPPVALPPSPPPVNENIPMPAVCWDGVVEALTGQWPENTES